MVKVKIYLTKQGPGQIQTQGADYKVRGYYTRKTAARNLLRSPQGLQSRFSLLSNTKSPILSLLSRSFPLGGEARQEM